VARAAATAVLLREALRHSRRWETYALRLLFSVIVMGVVAITIVTADLSGIDASQWSVIGRYLFFTATGLALAAVTVVAPAVVALGVVEEKDEGTLDLLVLTRLAAWQIVGGKIASRGLLLATILAGALPALAVVLDFGGVAVWELAGALSSVVLATCVLAGLAAFLAIEARGVALPYLAALAFSPAVFVVLPTLAVIVGARVMPCQPSGVGCDEIWAGSEISPYWSFPVGSEWSLLPWAVWGPPVALLALMGVPAFRLAAGRVEGHRYTVDSVLVAIFRWATLLVGGAILAATIVVHDQGLWNQLSAVVRVQQDHLIWLADVLCVQAGFLIYARLAMAGVAAASGRAGGPWRVLPRVRVGGGRWFGSWRTWFLLWNPVSWRESLTRAHGAAGAAAWIANLTWFLLLAWAAYEGARWQELAVFALFGGWFVAALVNVVLGTSAVVEEHGSRLELLLVTTMRPWRIVTGKVLGVMLRSSPPLVVGLLGYAVFGHEWLPRTNTGHDWSSGHYHQTWLPNLFPLFTPGRFLVLTAWFFVTQAVITLLAMSAAWRLPERLAWLVNLGAVVFVPPALATVVSIQYWIVEFARNERYVDWNAAGILELLVPFVAPSFANCDWGVPPQLLLATILWSGLAVALHASLWLPLRRYGKRWLAAG
jgi:ABC-type Na+ efflux pump permease subunit